MDYATTFAAAAEDAEDDLVIVDAGSYKWLVGFSAHMQDEEKLMSWGHDEPLEPTAGAKAARRAKFWQRLRSCVGVLGRRLNALFLVSVFDEAEGDLVREIAEQCLGGDKPLFYHVRIAPQEHLAAYAMSPRQDGLIVNLGCTHISTYALVDGHQLGPMVRRAPLPPSVLRGDDATAVASPEGFLRETGLTTLVVDVLRSAPVDLRGFFSQNIRLVGGRTVWPTGLESRPCAAGWLDHALRDAVEAELRSDGRALPIVDHRCSRPVNVGPSIQGSKTAAWEGAATVVEARRGTLLEQLGPPLTRATWQQHMEQRRCGAAEGSSSGSGDEPTSPSSSSPSLAERSWAAHLVPMDPTVRAAVAEEARRLVGCASSLVRKLPEELLQLIAGRLLAASPSLQRRLTGPHPPAEELGAAGDVPSGETVGGVTGEEAVEWARRMHAVIAAGADSGALLGDGQAGPDAARSGARAHARGVAAIRFDAALGEAADVSYLAPGSNSFSYEELKGDLPAGVDPTKKEQYLSDADFERIMKSPRAEFNEMKAWKRNQIKKAASLY